MSGMRRRLRLLALPLLACAPQRALAQESGGGQVSDTLVIRALELEVSKPREAIALYDVRLAAPADADPLDALEADFLAAESSERLAQAVRQTVQSNRRQVMKAA